MAKFDATLQVLALSSVHQHPDNIRDDLGDLTQLASEIKSMGVMSPLLVYPHPDRAGDFVVQDGNRRRSAAAEAGLTEVPCVVLPAPTAERGPRADIETMLSTGRNHRPLSEHEVSKGIQGLLDLGMDITTVGKKFKMSRKEVQARAKVAQKNDGVSKAYSAGRLRLDAVQRLQELEEQSDNPQLYERTVEKIESMANGASIETVERVIADTESSLRRDARRADLQELNAVEGDYDVAYSNAWSQVEDELTDAEHVEAGHKYRFHYSDPEPQWFVKEKKAKPELTEAEKQDKQTQAKLNSMLSIAARDRMVFIVEAVQNVKAEETFAKTVLAQRILDMVRFDNSRSIMLGKLITNEYPGDAEDAEETKWRANAEKYLVRLALTKLALVMKLIDLAAADSDIEKLKGFERRQHEGPRYGYSWYRVSQYYQLLIDQLGYTLHELEIEAMEYSAHAEPNRNREFDLVPTPDEVTATCQECSQEVVADAEWAGFCVNCIEDAGDSE